MRLDSLDVILDNFCIGSSGTSLLQFIKVSLPYLNLLLADYTLLLNELTGDIPDSLS
jgi:hypothetical protein